MTLQFWMGAACASILCWIFLWWFLSIGNKQADRKDRAGREAERLLAERNAIGIRQCVALEELVETMKLQSPKPKARPEPNWEAKEERDWVAKERGGTCG